MAKRSTLTPFSAQEIANELKYWVKCPMDPALRKVLKLATAAIEALIEPETPEPNHPLPPLESRIKDSE